MEEPVMVLISYFMFMIVGVWIGKTENYFLVAPAYMLMMLCNMALFSSMSKEDK